MKYWIFISIVIIPQLVPTLGTLVTVPEGQGSSASLIKGTTAGLFGNQNAKVLNAAARELINTHRMIPDMYLKIFSRSSESDTESDADSAAPHMFNNIMPVCAKHDCKKNIFMNEALRWVKQALKDVGVTIYEHPLATTALLIGVSVLLVEVISGGILVPVALEAIGYGAKGPVKNTVAAAMQSKINPVQLGSVFSKLQSAGMGGAAMSEIQKMAQIGIAGLIVAGASGLVGGDVKAIGPSASFNPQEWRAWELASRIDVSPEVASKMAQFWGAPKFEGCIVYGYQQVRASLWVIPSGMDPLTVCARTPASFNGIGYESPLGCVDKGAKEGVIATWYVPINSTRCMPQWAAFENEGCVLYGRRRRFARLMGLKNNDNWKSVCGSTPAIIDGKNYDEPFFCEDKGIGGIYGIFDIDDKQCECSCSRV